jgi:hypothetical protein
LLLAFSSEPAGQLKENTKNNRVRCIMKISKTLLNTVDQYSCLDSMKEMERGSGRPHHQVER